MSAAARNHEFLNEIMASVLRACDAVFGTTTVVLAVIGTWLLFTSNDASVGLVIALWSIPVLNVSWSVVTRDHDRVRSDLVRTPVCLPITTFIYVGGTGFFDKLWIPSMVMAAGAALSLGIAARNARLGHFVTAVYASSVLVAGVITDTPFHRILNHSVGIALTGCLLAIVGSRLGRVLDEARRQRDDALREKERAETTLVQLTERTAELMRKEIELRQAQKLESVGRLAAGVAHELNTPIQFVSDSLHFLREANDDVMTVVDKLRVVSRSVMDGQPAIDAATAAADAEEEVSFEYLQQHVPGAFARSLDGLARVANIVRSMKTFAHPGGAEMAPADINAAIESTITIAHSEYKLIADVETSFGELPPVTCHVGEINQTVLNMIVNAAHAIADANARTSRRGKIKIQTWVEGSGIVIAISDSGTGIPEAIRERIFDPFFTTKEVGRGTGQGLAVARSLVVDKHHGQLTVESEMGVGTTFFIRLPVAHAGSTAPASQCA